VPPGSEALIAIGSTRRRSTRVKGVDAVCPPASLTVTDTVALTSSRTVPLSTPVRKFSVTPGGSGPVIDHVYGVVPPIA
jgi:hypothetical protein